MTILAEWCPQIDAAQPSPDGQPILVSVEYRAGVVPKGTTEGERMHKARHSAAQRLLETTGNVKAVQALLGHESIQTTEQYIDWSDDQLAQSLARMLESDEE